MKKIFLLLLTTLLLTGCNSDDSTPQPINEIDKLPPPTQTGANTVGCLVDGKAFLPYGRVGFVNNPICNYIDDVFVLSFYKKNQEKNESIVISIDDGEFKSNKLFMLGIDKFRAGEFIVQNKGLKSIYFMTDSFSTGELYVSKFDRESGIISGTFWFDAVNKKGEKVEIREGRFDMQYYGN